MGNDDIRSHIVFAISDATGATGQRVVQAALAQFAGAQVEVELRPGVRKARAVGP